MIRAALYGSLLAFSFGKLPKLNLDSLINWNLNDDAEEEPDDATDPAEDGETEGSDSTGTDWYVAVDGDDDAEGTDPDDPLATLQEALDRAEPGDTIHLADGDYYQDASTARDGTEDAPIRVTGSADAVLRGAGGAHVLDIEHDHVWLEGFTLDGLAGDEDSEDGYRDKLLYAKGTEPYDGVTGMRILGMTLRNAGGECVRLRYFATGNEIAYSNFQNCGVHDYVFDAGGKNGEGIYIGTAPEQLTDGKNPTEDPDESNDNWIHDNVFDTQGNECVDIKEAASGNLVEGNVCTGQLDTESGGFDSRGSGNVFRDNEVFGCKGAGVRLGGDEDEDGIDNDVYDNVIYDNEKGGIKIQRSPQGDICGNELRDNGGGDAVGTYGDDYDPAEACP